MSWRELPFSDEDYYTAVVREARAKGLSAKLLQDVSNLEDEIKDEEAALSRALPRRPAERRLSSQGMRDTLYQLRRDYATARGEEFLAAAEANYLRDRLRIYASLPQSIKELPSEETE